MMVLSTLVAFGPFATDMYLASFPQIAASLGSSLALVQLTLSVYLIGLGGGQVLYGPVIDHFGRRLPLLAGIGVFALSSLACAVTTDIHVMIAMRLLQAVGGGAGMVIGRAIVRDLFEVTEAAHFMSVLMMAQSLGPILAPALGGVLLLVGDWRLLFAIMAAYGAVCWTTVFRLLPETLRPERRKPLSFAEFLAAFAWLLRHREFIVTALTSSVAMSSMFAFITGSPFVFMKVYGASAQGFGFLFAGTTLGMLVAATVNRMLLRHFTPATIFKGAVRFHLAATTALVLATATHSLAITMVPLALCVSTVPILLANGSALTMQASGPYVGSASAVYGLLQFVMASVTSSLIGVFHDGTAWPMAEVMLGVSFAGNAVFLLRSRGPRRVPSR